MTCIMSRGKKPGRRCVYDETQGPLEPWVPCKGDEIPKLGGFEEIGNLKRQDLSVFMIPESLHAEIKQPNASRQLSSTTPDLQHKGFKDLIQDLSPDDPVSVEAARILSKCFPLHDRATVDKVVKEAIAILQTDNPPASGCADLSPSVEGSYEFSVTNLKVTLMKGMSILRISALRSQARMPAVWRILDALKRVKLD